MDRTMPRGLQVARLTWLAILLLGLAVLLMQLALAHRFWTPVGFVDAWPLYDRLMRFSQGQLSLDHYLLDPHVHPHSIVYLLYLIDARLGSGRQVVPHVATLVGVVALALLLAGLCWQARPAGTRGDLRLALLLAGIAILVSGVSEATIIPFQCVVVVTRVTYVGLLAILVFCQFRPRPALHAAALAASTVAISFYASAGVFAAEIVLLHLLAMRRWVWLLLSALPLAAYLLLMAHYPPPLGEENAIRALIQDMDWTTLARIAAGAAAYYATPLVEGWWAPLTPAWDASSLLVTAIGAVVGIVTTVWALAVLGGLFIGQWRRGRVLPAYTALRCLMALLSLWVLASALSAALLWLARARILGPAMGPAHYNVLVSGRYAAFAGLAFVVLLFLAATMRRRRSGLVIAGAMFALVCGDAVHAGFRDRGQGYRTDERRALDLASTALLMGLPPTAPEARAVWPDAPNYAFWVGELPKIEAFLRAEGLSYAQGQPMLAQVVERPAAAVDAVTILPVADDARICRLHGTTAPFQARFTFAPRRVQAVTLASGIVVGYALRDGTMVEGHMLCVDASDHQALFVAGTR